MRARNAHIKQGRADHSRMAESRFSEITLTSPKTEYSSGENIEITAGFSIQGGIRNAFNEDDWTKAYEANDVSFKLKYGARLVTAGGFRKKAVGRPVDTYRKASIFWTRNPKLVNPMKDKRIWVQVAKNFEPYIRLSEEEVRGELFDFAETFVIKPSELGGGGTHRIGAEVYASWQKHQYAEAGSIKNDSDGIEITILN